MSRLIDSQGNETKTSALSFSGGDSNPLLSQRVGGFGIELVRGVARTGHLRFEGIEVVGGQVPLIEIRFNGTRGASDGRVQFRNVSVK